MINKTNLWFVTLFSLILILGIYYVTMIDKEKTLATIKESVNSNNKDDVSVEVEDSSALVALRVKEDEDVIAKMEELQDILLDNQTTMEEKNNAYESLQSINSNKGKEQELEKLIKKEFSLNSFIKISGDKIVITIASDKHDTKIANDIIVKIQSLYQDRMFITVRFQK